MTALDVLVPTSGPAGPLAVTLTALACVPERGLRVVSDRSPSVPSYDDPVVRGVLRVLAHRGTRVELHRPAPRQEPAEHRDTLLRLATAERVVLLEDDVLLAPARVRTLLDETRTADRP